MHLDNDLDLHVSRMLIGRYPIDGERLAKFCVVILEDVRKFHADQTYSSKTLDDVIRYNKNF